MTGFRRLASMLCLVLLCGAAQAATQFSEKDYYLYPGDFNGDGKTDLLYIGKTPDKPNGIALADASGAPQIGFQSWPATYLGIPWSTGQYVPLVGDFNGDGKSDVLMQAATAGTSYLLLANTDTTIGAVGQLVGINQGIAQTSFGITWSADQHKILVGDFDGDGKDDVLLQATAKGDTNAIILSDSSGNLFTRSAAGINCSTGGPQQCWTDGEAGLDWSTKSAVLSVGKFNADARTDILYMPRPNIVMIDYDIPIPVPVFKPNTFGIFLSQMTSSGNKVLISANQLWSKSDLGAQWSPMNVAALMGDFNGDGYGDVLLQSKGGSNLLLYANSSGVLGTAVTPASNVAGWNGSSYTAVVGKFGNNSRSTLYLQAKDGSGGNYYTSDISAGSVSATASSMQLVASVPTDPPTAIGATPATADVTQNGSASYSIPIQLPRGTAGLTPDLALTYSSGAGNGLVGIGWNLSGLGIITRCPKTMAQDGVTQGVQLTTNDEYCLNGNRLRRVSGSQGQTGSQYRTELETYALTTVLSSTSVGPTAWQVKTREGLVYEYGGTSDSRIGVMGNSTGAIRVWALSKVSDRALGATSGNYWTIAYVNDVTSTGSYRPDYIDYTTSTAASPSAAPYRVQFFYENRNTGENVMSYYAGPSGFINQTQRLKRIELQSSGGAAMIRKYTLTYETPTSTFNLVSRLGSVQECSPTACMAPTTFGWSDTPVSNGFQAFGTPVLDARAGNYTYPLDTPGYYGTVRTVTLDINGDGIPDAVRIRKEEQEYPPGATYTTYQLFIGTPSGQVEPGFSMSSYPVENSDQGVYDMDEDGKDDFIFVHHWLHQKSDGTYALEDLTPAQTQLPGVGSNLIDVDGDGYLDAVAIADNTHLSVRFHRRDGVPGLETSVSTAWTAPSGTTIAPYAANTTFAWNVLASQHVVRADVNGDGRQDLLLRVSNGWRVLYSNGTGFTTGELIVPATGSWGDFVSTYLPVIALDINGDGCTDFAYPKALYGQNYWYLATSYCGSVGSSLNVDGQTGIALSTTALEWQSVAGADVNGDGNMDLVVGPVVLLSTGANLVSYGTNSVSSSNASNVQYWSDRNGDGVLDYVGCSLAGDSCSYWPGTGKRGNMLVSATDGFGKSATFDYAPLTDSSVYTRGTTGIGRTQDLQSSMYVVKSMALSDGIGGKYKLSYSYAGAKRNVAGRGFLGFASREIKDDRTGFLTREAYNNTVANDGSYWEYVGTLASRTVYQYKNGSSYGPKVEELTQQYNAILPDGASDRRYPYVGSAVVTRYELTGSNSPITTATTTTTIDNYGTPYDVTTTTVEGISGLSAGTSATVRRYTPTSEVLNDTTNWCIARPQQVQDIRSHTLNATDGAQISRVSTQTWDASRCRVTHITVAPGSGWQLDTEIEYDDFNNVKKTTVTGSGIPSSNPIITQADFGGNGHLQQSATNAKGHQTTFAWNVNLGFRTGMTDPNSQTTTWIPDDFGREKEMIRPDGTRTYKSYYNCTSTNSYCGDGLLRYVVRTESRNAANDPNNLINYADQFVDMMGRVKYEQSRGFGGQTVVTESLYDNRGNLALKTNPYFAGSGSVSGVSMTYDTLNRLTQTQRPVSDSDRTVVNEYVVYEGLKVRSFDANGHETSKTSNVLGTVARAVDDAGKVTGYTYNSFGELLTATDPAGNVNSIQYNARGFKSSSMDPDLGSWTYTYDALGQMLSQTDAKSQTTSFVYDELGRVKKRTDHPGTAADETNWTWDGPGGVPTLYNKGQLYNVTSPGGYSETYAYDIRARRSQMTTVAASTTFVMDYGYDASLGMLSSVTYPASTGTRLTVSYSYQNGFARDVRDASNGNLIWQANAQDPRGHVTQEQYGNGQVTNLGFDQTNGRLYTIQTGTSAATQNLTYAWDAVGNLLSRRDNNQNVTEAFGYDALYRLTSVQRNGGSQVTMTYNDIGNLASKSDVGAYTYPTGTNPARPHAVTAAGSGSYSYDSNGNMMSKTVSSVVTTVSWSTYDYPLSISQAGGNSSTFSYGADRNRYRTISVDGGVTEDKLEIAGGAFEKVVSGTSIQYRHHIQVNGKAVAIWTRNANTSAPTTLASAKSLYLHEDHLGSLDVITDETNAIVVRTSFDAWGQRRGSNWTGTPSAADKAAIAMATRKGYTGHQQLDNLNLVHMNGRVYDPAIGRFMSADPIIQDPYHSQAFNRYSYVWNNPLNGTDPSGFKCVPHEGIQLCETTPSDELTKHPEVSPVQQNGHGQGDTNAGKPTVKQAGEWRSAQDLARGEQPANARQSPQPEVPSYLQGVGDVFKGYGDAAVGAAEGAWQLVRHPIDSIVGIGTAVAHPLKTAHAIYDDISEDMRTNRGSGRVVGNVLLSVLGAGAARTAAEVSAAAARGAGEIGAQAERQVLRATDKQIGRKFGEHRDLDRPGYRSHDEYRQRANDILNNPGATITRYPQGSSQFAGETHYQVGSDLLRLDASGTFRSLYPVK